MQAKINSFQDLLNYANSKDFQYIAADMLGGGMLSVTDKLVALLEKLAAENGVKLSSEQEATITHLAEGAGYASK